PVAVQQAAGYSNLEFDLASGGRGSRTRHAASLVARAAGAEAALVVNNGAAAVLLVLASLARSRGVVVSRGELVEIGGGFRVPAGPAASCSVPCRRRRWRTCGVTGTPSRSGAWPPRRWRACGRGQKR